ncbi:MAG: prenyltransferase/squalene oxidase repeat-containing protein [Pirellulaceae bacterium]
MSNVSSKSAADLQSSLDPGDLEEFTYWPVNLVLIILGGTILGTAFVYLDPLEGNLARNPWTYVVVTPICLMLISILLNTIVSRIVEKSMQMAFLLSVLVHLFLIIGAMNVVIFSRLWPEVIESMAKEREVLKRQQLQARQYHRVSASRKSASRPDYLRHVPTEHQPTELALAASPSVTLSRSNVENLVSPQPEIELTLNPHILSRKQPSPSTPNPRDTAASLSRNELRSEMTARSQPQQFEMQDEAAPSLRATAAESRRNDSRSPNSTAIRQLPEMKIEPSAMAASNLQPNVRRQNVPAPEFRPNEVSALAKAKAAAVNRPVTGSQIPQLDAASEAVASTLTEPSAQRTANQRQRTTTPLASLQPSALSGMLRPEPTKETTATTPSLERRNLELTIPEPSSGSQRAALSRSTAGGNPGAPAANSMPIQGVESVATQTSSERPLQSARIATDRSSPRRRTSAGGLSMGAPSAPSWTGAPSMSSGIAGRSPSQVLEAATNGSAAAYDVAGLTGQERAMQRSQSGISGPQGTLAGPESPNASSSQGAVAVAEPELTANDATDRGYRQRSRSSQALLASPDGQQTSRPDSITEGSAELAARATAEPTQSLEPVAGSPGVNAPRARSVADSGAPAVANVEVAAMQPIDTTSEASGVSPSSAMESIERRASGAKSSGNLLAIDAAPGFGGVSPLADARGDLLPRRKESTSIELPSDLTVQRFERKDVGGPLAAGQIALPTPAFQQRIDRTKDRIATESSSAEPQTELAIERGLEFLAKHQREDGSWRLQDFDTQVLMTSDTAATGLALLAFQGAGYTHKNFKYAEVCDKAIQFLRSNQRPTGDLYIPQNPASDQNAWLYSHGIAAIAMCEAYGMTQDSELREPAQLCIDFIETSQDPQRGGWRYRPGMGSDTSVSGWFMMALKSAQLAGLDVNPQTFVRLKGYLAASQDPSGNAHLYRYNPDAANTPQQRHGLEITPVMTSVGLLMRLYTGWQRGQPEMQAGAQHLLLHLPEDGTKKASKRDTYYWYYATQVMFHVGGDTWAQWRDSLYPLLLESQVLEGEYEGSWSPSAPTPDLWARYGGRLYVTTMNLLSLEVTYRHLPLYEVQVAAK